MTPEQREINKFVLRKERSISVANAWILQAQEKCEHPDEHMEIINHATDGYAEPTEYWRVCRCGVCKKRWTESQASARSAARVVKEFS